MVWSVQWNRELAKLQQEHSCRNYTVVVTDGTCSSAAATGNLTVNALPTVDAGADQAVCSGDTVTLTGKSTLFSNALSIKGIMDLNAPSSSNDGKAIHLVANEDIADLSIYGFNNSNNGGGSDGVEWSFPIGSSASAGDDILVYRIGTDPNFFSNYFGSCWSNFEQTFNDATANSVLTMNGDDPMELFLNGVVIDNYGDVNASAMPGDPYEDSWAYRNADGTWTEGGEDCDVESPDQYTVTSSGCPYPLCSEVPITFTWNNSVTNESSFIPTATTTYTVTGTDGNGCTGTDQVDVTVNTLPTVSAGADQAVCDGGAVTLSGSGASTYAWDNVVTDGATFTPTATTTYTVTGTDGNGCSNTDQVMLL